MARRTLRRVCSALSLILATDFNSFSCFVMLSTSSLFALFESAINLLNFLSIISNVILILFRFPIIEDLTSFIVSSVLSSLENPSFFFLIF